MSASGLFTAILSPRRTVLLVFALGLVLLAAWPTAANEPTKAQHKYPNLDSTLRQLVERYEEEQAGRPPDTPSDDPTSGADLPTLVTIHLSSYGGEIAEWLQGQRVTPRNVGPDYIEAHVPVSLLGELSMRPGVAKVRIVVPPNTGANTGACCLEPDEPDEANEPGEADDSEAALGPITTGPQSEDDALTESTPTTAQPVTGERTQTRPRTCRPVSTTVAS